MEILTAIGVLRRHRIALVVGVLVAALAYGAASGVLSLHGRPAARSFGVALARAFVDTTEPLVGEAMPHGADSILQRTALLADLLATDRGRATVARSAGIRADDLQVVDISLTAPVLTDERTQRANLAWLAASARPYVVTLRINEVAPMLTIETVAQDPGAAAKLAQATITAMTTLTAHDNLRIPDVRIQTLGPIKRDAIVPQTDAARLVGGVAAVAVFALWCVGIVIASGLARFWRAQVRAQEA